MYKLPHSGSLGVNTNHCGKHFISVYKLTYRYLFVYFKTINAQMKILQLRAHGNKALHI